MPSSKKSPPSRPHLPLGVSDRRAVAAFEVRINAAAGEAQIPVPPHTTNGDESRYPDKIATYSKCLKQDAPCLVNLQAYKLFRKALDSGKPSAFANLLLGGARTLNNPQAAYAFTLAGTDGWQFGNAPSPANQESGAIVPPPPAMASEAYGTELVELYWCSLLRDVAFTDYASNALAAQAAAELSAMPTYAGPRNSSGDVTPDLLFRGAYPGETVGPYLSQLLVQPTTLGEQAISQQLTTYLPNIDYMTDLTTWQDVQNGISTGLSNQKDPVPRYLHDGRGLAAYTHVDELFQAYFVAYLVLEKLGIPYNPGNPYNGSKTQNGFGTFGGPDIASTLALVAKIALNAVWFQKWIVHLRHRPESGGGIVHLIRTGQGGNLSGSVNDNVLNSSAVAASFAKYGTCLLSQTFPEGSPSHPAYPTGHGTVAGACITVLKFFYDGTQTVPSPQIPASDGLSLHRYTGSDAGTMTINGELNKLAHNITFAHGLHGGIHWRSDSDVSLLLGEAVAISVLRDVATTYNEKFKVQITKLDGSPATIEH
jgi:hypothetical protein